jgi:para-nitrobenzyl esterase
MPPGRSLVVVAVALAATLTGTANATTAPVVRTTEGLVRGVATESTTRFLGLPYAAPPVGSLRWRPPQSPARWHGVRDANAPGSACAQPPDTFGIPSTTEDCLYLNVYAPRKRAHHRPVMVWIHGGNLVNGTGAVYDPTKLVRDGVVVVTINYRLGALGFLAHPAFGAASGNYGLMDQQKALRWVAGNIANFGGNPDNVTIFGESAGGLSVLSHLVSPTSRGLFDRAIVQSGAYALTQDSLSEAESAGESFATRVGCADQSAACLRGLPVTTVLAAQDGGYTPNLDGRTLTQSIGTALEKGQFARVPLINGSNHDEWRLFVAISELQGQFVTAENYLPTIQGTLGVPPEVAAVIAAEYPLSAYPSPAVAMSTLGTDVIFACPALTVDNAAARHTPTYAYEFADENAPDLLPPVSFPQAAAHAAELPYLFDMPIGGPLNADQQKLASTMRQNWATFADRGAPNWPKFVPAKHEMVSFVPPRPRLTTDFATEHKCAFWSALTGGAEVAARR